MKKQGIYALLLVTGLFAAFLVGLFVGRNLDHQPLSFHTLSPTAAPTDPTPAPPPETTQPSYPVNINTAGKEALMLLPGIGEILAQRILDYRAAHGAFSSVEDLNNVEGIGEKTLEGLRDYATVGGQP